MNIYNISTISVQKRFLRALTVPIVACLALASCQGGEEPSVSPGGDTQTGSTVITLNISTSQFGKTSSRAEDYTSQPAESPNEANELINNWVVAFFQGADLKGVAEGNPASASEDGTAVWNDQVSLELPRGTYTAIAFANMDADKVKDSLSGYDLSNADWKKKIFEVEGLADGESDLIPMSGYRTVTVTGTVNETFAIEVVRMKAKIEYSVRNLSSEKVAVESFSFTPCYKGNIFLFPEYANLPTPDSDPTVEPSFPSSGSSADTYETVTHMPSGLELAASSATSVLTKFYIKESVATGNHPTDHFHIGLKLKRGEAEAEDVTYALAADQLKFICRNDYILFPIVISDYVPEFEVIDFPPIGGYPVKVEAVNNEFYATFSSSGAFDISARLRDTQGRTVAIHQYDGTTSQENYVRYLGGDPSMTLTYDAALGTWQGNFPQGTNQHITLKFEFKIGSLIYTRSLHLISK